MKDYLYDIKLVKEMADEENWLFVGLQKNIGMISFTKEIRKKSARINIYLTSGTVGTALHHPKKGKTQMFRKHVPARLLKKIFRNPRQHTDLGYRYKNGGKLNDSIG